MSAVTLAGLSKYGMDWDGEKRRGKRQVTSGVRKVGYETPDSHQRVMATLKFNVRLVNGAPLCIVKLIFNCS